MCNDASDCCRTTAKVLLIIINIIFWLAGLLMLAFGIALVAAPGKVIGSLSDLGENDFDNFKQTSDGFFQDLVRACGIFMIVMGGVVAIIACFGFFGACCESRCMLITYAIILIIIVLAEVALIIFAAVFPDKFEKTGKKAFYESLEESFKHDFNSTSGSYESSSPGKSEGVWNLIQWKLECCGVYGHGDYHNSTVVWSESYCDNADCTPGTQQLVPLSCCKLKDSSKIPKAETDYVNNRECIKTANGAYTNLKGCGDAAKDLILDYSKIAIGIAAGIVGLELILIALAFILCCMWSDRSGKYV